MFAGNRRGLSFPMKDGDRVICGGSVEVYERDGKYQLYAREIRREGAGVLYERFLALKKELEEMGMFDARYKMPIPKYAMRVGIVTAPTGAAIRDIQNIAKRRNPYVQLILSPALVQGEGAAASIAHGIEALDRKGVDVIIVGRGGGSLEDLWAFNEEAVARAIFYCETPVISAVGHETDTTIADYAADLRAPTPSAAAELAVFDYTKFCERMEGCRSALKRRTEREIAAARGNIRWYQARLAALSPASRLNDRRRRLADAEERMSDSMQKKLEEARKKEQDFRRYLSENEIKLLESRKIRYAMLIERFKGLNPLDKLNQGFSYVTDSNRKAVVSIAQVKRGDMLRIRVADGSIAAEARETEKDG